MDKEVIRDRLLNLLPYLTADELRELAESCLDFAAEIENEKAKGRRA